MILEFMPWPIRAVVRRLVEPLLVGLTGALVALGLTLPAAECVDLLAREALGLPPSASSSSSPKPSVPVSPGRSDWRVVPDQSLPASE